MTHRTIRGRINYISDEEGENGREWFTMTVDPDGSRVIRCQCEMDNYRLQRDVVFAVDADWQPRDCSVRVSIDHELVGSGWFRFTDTFAECETLTTQHGRVSQRWPLERPCPVFISHAVTCDVWQIALFDRQSGDKIQRIEGRLSSSTLPNGGSGPMLSAGFSGTAGPGVVDLEYLETKSVTVPAGKFEADHFAILREGKAPLEIWGMGDDIVPVKLRWDLLNQSFDLVELEM